MASSRTTAHTVYPDVCCLNRPFDDQTQFRIWLETEAISLILARVRAGEWRWLTREAVAFELEAGPTGTRRQWIEHLLRFATEAIPISPPVIERARQPVALGIRALDALHLACAESGRADVLLTTDDQFLRAAQRNAARLRVDVHDMTAQPKTARTPEQVRADGIQALAAALGPDDLVRFLLQFDRGSGDYTAERQAWVDRLDLDTILRRLVQHGEAPQADSDQAAGPSR